MFSLYGKKDKRDILPKIPEEWTVVERLPANYKASFLLLGGMGMQPNYISQLPQLLRWLGD